MTQEKREVKTDEVTEDDLKALEDASEEQDTTNTDEEEQGEDEQEELGEEEDESEPEDEPEDKNVEPSSSGSSTEIKEVAGETPKEKALRLEVTRVKRKMREMQMGKVFSKKEESPTDEKALEELGYTPEEFSKIENLFDIVAEKKGYVRKDQSYQAMANETLEEFIEAHPEYSAQNDTDDIRWTRFNEILKEDYNINGKTSKQLQVIFNKINRDVQEELGETPVKKNEVDQAKKTQAQRQKIQSVSAGASSPSKTKEAKPKIQSTHSRNIGGVEFKGFDDDDFEGI